MGNGLLGAKKQRYTKGKTPQKYFTEDMWPTVQDLFEKLSIDETRGFELFRAFCAMDADAGGTVDVDECFRYLGGRRTRFTERVFHDDGKAREGEDIPEGLAFREFAIAVWQYCTLSAAGLARMCFEVLDVDGNEVLEKPDIEAMYRLMYDCDEHDPYYVNAVPYNQEDMITKSAFCEFASRYRSIIQPAIDYQRLLRRKLGGFIMWETLAGYRRRHFLIFDSKASTLGEALVAIINSEDVHRKRRQLEASRILAEKKLKLEQEAERVEAELRQLEREKEQKQRRDELTAEDRPMKVSWFNLEAMRNAFEDDEFTVDEVWRRKEARMDLFRLFDLFVEASNEYYKMKDQKEMDITIGTDKDHEARYQDYIKTPEGALDYQRVLAKTALESLQVKYNEMHAKKKGVKKSNKHIDVENALEEIERKTLRAEKLKEDLISGDVARVRAAKSAKPSDFKSELQLAKSLSSRTEMQAAEKQVLFP